MALAECFRLTVASRFFSRLQSAKQPTGFQPVVIEFWELIELPWRIIYKIEENKLLVLAVIDGRRNVEDILLDRFVD